MSGKVYRAIRNGWLDDGLLTEKAFRRRAGKDLDGLSVSTSHNIAKRTQRSGAGVAALILRDIEQLGLQVVFAGDHGAIQGLPFDSPQNYAVVIEFADRLCRIAVFKQDRW